MTGIIGADERFVETIEVGGEILDRQEGTIQQLAATSQVMGAAPAPRPGGKVDDVIKVLSFAWDIVKDTKAQAATEGARTRVLSAQDDNWVNYENAVDFTSPEVKYKLDNFVGVNCYTVHFQVAGTFKARHRALGGAWLPLVHIAFSRCEANLPWIIEGKASIAPDMVSNMATREDPVPQILLGVKISTRAHFVIGWESHERNFVFNVNGKSGVKLVSAR